MSVMVTRTTAPGRGAIAVIEVVGAGAASLVGPLFSRPLPPPGRPRIGRLVEEGPVDEVVLRVIPAGRSFTGEETIEITCHGGEIVVERVVGALSRRGAERADPRRRLERARARGRIDPIQEEAFALLPEALTELAARVLLDQAHGALSRAIREGRAVLATAPLGIALASPRRLVLAGRPNSGKSTLFNALTAEDRVLVSDQRGTTRDPVTELIAIEGVPFHLSDTAGVGGGREPDLLEMLSAERTREEIGTADLLLLLHELPAGVRPEEEEFLAQVGRPVLRLAGKCDLGGEAPGLRVSGRTGEGLGALRRAILQALGIVARHEPGSPVVFTERQKALLEAGEGGQLLR